MKISIIGSGAMGSLYGGKLSLAGHDVVLYDVYREHVEAVRKSGLSIEEAGRGDVAVAHPGASSDPASLEGSDVFIIFVKSTATEQAAAQLARYAGPSTIVLTLQNGLGNEEIIRRHFGESRTAAGVTSQGATFLGPGRIRHAGSGPTHVGMADRDNTRLSPLADALNGAGFETHVVDDVASLVWSKLVINVGINGLTALIGQTNGRLLEFEETGAIMADLVAEAVAVARARGVRFTYSDPLATVRDVAAKTGANRSSMLQDFDRHRESEIDFMNGAIVREAAALGIAAPVNATVTRLVKTLDRIHAGQPV
ncbi:MAG TPA: 2-dehydropantoate 2-reductase [Spirochaetia bacterium]|nr:2-dehydropantoate 2-reductase [Spirochaetia bacterium]